MRVENDLDFSVTQQGITFQDSLLGQLREINNHLMRRQQTSIAKNPIIKTVGGSAAMLGVASGGFAGTVEISEHPSRGRVWNILKAVVTSTDGHTAPSGTPTVDLYAGTLIDPGGAPVLSALIQGNAVIPSVNYWSRLVEWCPAGESIFGLVYGGPVGVAFNVNLSFRVADYAVEAAEGMHT